MPYPQAWAKVVVDMVECHQYNSIRRYTMGKKVGGGRVPGKKSQNANTPVISKSNSK